tara:strand:+ start:2064 stop:3356 length:1293 start_codon:yes stop_codon:yes gene_type:complete
MAKTFDYPFADLVNPQGKNNLGALAGFYQRSLYKEGIYPAALPRPLDVWHDKFMYGRVDQFQNTVVPQLINLKAIPSSGPANVMALNVVVNAFEKFVRHMQKATWVRAVVPEGNPALLDIKAARAYESPNAKYSQFTQNLFNAFLKNLSGKQKFAIQDFSSFLKFYRPYLLDVAQKVPITKTNYVLSSGVSLMGSGLSIAISNLDASDDGVKYRQFISDPNFEFFRRCAKKYGFIVNKNAPWILTADLFTDAFLATGPAGYAVTGAGTTVNKDNFFDIFYTRTYTTDFEDLLRILINSYAQLIHKAPFYDEEVGTVDSACSIVAKPRVPLNMKAAEYLEGHPAASALPIKFLIDLYIDLRQVEVQNPLSAPHLAALKREAYQVFSLVAGAPESLRLGSVAHYVNLIYRQYIYAPGAVDMQRRERLDRESP